MKNGCRKDLDLFCKAVTPVTGINNPKPFNIQFRKRRPHGRRQAGRIGPLDLDTYAAPPPAKEKIDLRTCVGRPEVGFVRLDVREQFLNDMPFPRCTALRMGEKILFGADAQELMEKAAIPEVYLWRFDLSFFDVRMPGRQLPDHEDPFQQIQVAANG